MLHINRVTLLGHAGRDPDIRMKTDGGKVASFSLATTRRWKDKDGRPSEATEWHRIAVFGGAVRVVEEMVRKGSALLVEGRVGERAFTDKQGNERQVTEIVVAGAQGMVNVLTPKSRGGGPREAGDTAAGAASAEGDETVGGEDASGPGVDDPGGAGDA